MHLNFALERFLSFFAKASWLIAEKGRNELSGRLRWTRISLRVPFENMANDVDTRRGSFGSRIDSESVLFYQEATRLKAF